jgi:hypothetical protein
VANINGRTAEEYRVEGSPKPAPYKTPEPIAKPKQTKPPAIPTIADAERVLADLDAQRRNLAAARAADDAEMSRVAYGARVLHQLEASRSLREIAARTLEHDQRVKEIDAALVTARSVLKEAQAAESKAQAREVAAELLKRAVRLVQHGQSLDDAGTIRVELSCAIAEELQQMRALAHGIGVHVPSHEQFLAMGSRADLTAAMGTPFARNVGEHLPPNERRSHLSYVQPWSDAIMKAARAILGEGKSREAA